MVSISFSSSSSFLFSCSEVKEYDPIGEPNIVVRSTWFVCLIIKRAPGENRKRSKKRGRRNKGNTIQFRSIEIEFALVIVILLPNLFVFIDRIEKFGENLEKCPFLKWIRMR